MEVNPVARLAALPTKHYLTFVCANNDGLRAWAASAMSGGIILTKDGGQTWKLATIHFPPSWPPKDVFIPSSHATEREIGGAKFDATISEPDYYAPEDDGFGFVSRDFEISAIDEIAMMADGRSGVAVGGAGILHTSDGGETWDWVKAMDIDTWWSQVMLRQQGATFVVYSLDDHEAWKSTDGGATWFKDEHLGITPKNGENTEHGFVDLDESLSTGLFVSDSGVAMVLDKETGSWKDKLDSSRHESGSLDSRLAHPNDVQILNEGGLLIVSSEEGGTWRSRSDDGWSPTNLRHGRWLCSTFRDEIATAILCDKESVTGNETFRMHTSTDSGVSWREQGQFSSPVRPARGCFSPSGEYAWMVCAAGGIFRSNDGGRSFHAVTQNAVLAKARYETSLEVVTDDHGQVPVDDTGRAVTAKSTKLTGYAFTPQHLYLRMPPPLFFLGLLAIGLVLVRPAMEASETPAEHESIADFAVSDAPLKEGERDAADLSALASGLSYFILNRDTMAPLCLAINGEWGSGKSSLMGLVKARLEARGWRSVWFNAWHHQKEEHMLAALVDSLQKDSAPRLFTPRGLAYRARLAWLRLDTNWGTALLWALALAAGLGWILANQTELARLAALLTEPAETGKKAVEAGGDEKLWSFSNVLRLLGALVSLGLVGKPLLVLLQSLKSFGIDPAKLMAGAAADSQLADLRDKTSFRYRFAQEFKEVTLALQPDSRLVIFIDDLDRCQPEQMLVMLEDVNYLVSTGECFIILGMEEKAVRNCLATQMEARLKDDLDTLPDAAAKRDLKRDYVDKWMEKLVQVHITVPALEFRQASALLTGDEAAPEEAGLQDLVRPLAPPPEPAWKRRAPQIQAQLVHLGRQALTPARLLLSIAIIALVFTQARRFLPLHLANKNEVKVTATAVDNPPAAEQTKPPSEAVTAPIPKAPPTEIPAARPKARTASPGGIVPGDGWWFWLWVPLMIFLLVVGIAWPAWQVFIRQLDDKARDSPEFKTAVTEWMPLLLQMPADRRTPRSLKRFLNRVRFYAMLLRANAPAADLEAGTERLLVAYGAIETCYPGFPGTQWRERLTTLPPNDWLPKVREIMTRMEAWQQQGKARLFFRVKRAWTSP